MQWPGTWNRRPAPGQGALERCEARIGTRLPDDLRAFLSASDGGEAWFTERHPPPGFCLLVLGLDDIAALHEDGFGRELGLAVASDGGSEYFHLHPAGGPIRMNHAAAEPEEAVECPPTVSGLIDRLAAGWSPFDELRD
jgi:hypothetical protein